jgi:hypothetical protein
MALVGQRRVHLAHRLPAGLAQDIDRAPLGENREPGGK